MAAEKDILDNLTEIATIVGGIGSAVATWLAYSAVKEMSRQRTESYKPDLILKESMHQIIYKNDRFSFWGFGVSHEQKYGETQVQVINAGLGNAKHIKYKTYFNIDEVESYIRTSLKDQSHFEIEIFHHEGDEYYTPHYSGLSQSMGYQLTRESKLTYIQPIDKIDEKTHIYLPHLYFVLLAIYVDIEANKNEDFNIIESGYFYLNSFPPLWIDIEYEDLTGNKYIKEFKSNINRFNINIATIESANGVTGTYHLNYIQTNR